MEGWQKITGNLHLKKIFDVYKNQSFTVGVISVKICWC